MKKLLLASATLLASGAFAGVHIDNITRDVGTKEQKGGVHTTLVQNGMMRTNSTDTGAVIIKSGSMIMIDDKRKQYREMTKEDMKKMAAGASAAMARMQEQMKNMKPEQRAMMEKMMGDKIAGGMGTPGKADTWDSKDTGKTATVEGRSCKVWILSRNGAPFEELCVVPYGSLPGKEDLQKVFKDFADAFADIAKNAPGADQAAKARAAINGYPVRTRTYEGDGKFRSTETIMTKWVEESIPASAFDVPAGYKKMEMPQMPPH